MVSQHDVPEGERRRDARRDVDLPARLSLVGMTVDGRLRNVSARGVCFVTSNPDLRVDEANFVEIRFTLPAAEGGPSEVRRFVRITRIEPAEVEGRPGRSLGVAWDEPLRA